MMRSTRQSRASWRPRHWSSSRPSRLRSTDCTWWRSHGTGRHRLMGTAVLLDITNPNSRRPLPGECAPVLRSCVEAFLQLRHAAPLDSVPRGPAHASVLRGTEPARQELRRDPAQCPCRRHTHLP
eukprot:XP_001707923.1 Hypothetical protein GL50803_35155 [Giardia lamblia ATCC 50803]